MSNEDNVPKLAEGQKSFTSFFAMLEDGVLHSDISKELNRINAELNDHAQENGGKAKGKLSIEIGFLLEKGVFEITSSFKTKMPEQRRLRTIAWSTPGNNFTPHNPRQMSLFEKPKSVGIDREETKDVI